MTQTALDERVRAAVGGKVPGVALVVVGAEGVRARSAVGLADLGTQAPMRTNLAIPWFSMTKIATATAAMRLVEGGLLELDGPVLPLVAAMRSLRPAAWAQRITARHLLQHSAGLANPIPVRWIHPAEAPGPDQDELLTRLLSRHARLRFPPGVRSSYSNLGTLTLGAAIARVSQARFEAVVGDELLEPVAMAATGFSYVAGASNLELVRPAGVPVRVRIGGGASKLAIDNFRVGAGGGRTDWRSPDYDLVEGRYDVEIGAGASKVTVRT